MCPEPSIEPYQYISSMQFKHSRSRTALHGAISLGINSRFDERHWEHSGQIDNWNKWNPNHWWGVWQKEMICGTPKTCGPTRGDRQHVFTSEWDQFSYDVVTYPPLQSLTFLCVSGVPVKEGDITSWKESGFLSHSLE